MKTLSENPSKRTAKLASQKGVKKQSKLFTPATASGKQTKNKTLSNAASSRFHLRNKISFEGSTEDNQEKKDEVSSRIRITSLPRTITKERLLKLFSGIPSNGSNKAHVKSLHECITDCVILRNAAGAPRMAFVGFHKIQHARTAVARLDGTFIENIRINVVMARPVVQLSNGDQSMPCTKVEEESDNKLCVQNSAVAIHPERPSQRGAFDEPCSQSDPVSLAQEPSRADAVLSSLQADDDFLQSLTVPPNPALPDHELPTSSPAPDGVNNNPDVHFTKRILIKNVSFTATEEEVRSLSQRVTCGPVESVVIPRTVDTGRSRGVAFVTFLRGDDAKKAQHALHGRIFQGRVLTTEVAAAPGPTTPIQLSRKTTRLRSSVTLEKRRSEAMKESAWNPLYLTGDTVAQAISSKLDVPKSDFLDSAQPNIAVRAAVAEATLTMELRNAFNEEGIDIPLIRSANAYTQRSTTTLMVKNVKGSSENGQITPDVVKELQTLFQSVGEIERVAVPTGVGIVLVAFTSPEAAKTAMQWLSFRPFHGLPLFLEWAPVGAVAPNAAKRLETREGGVDSNEEDAEYDSEEDPSCTLEGTTLHVRNIPHMYTTSEFSSYIRKLVASGALRRGSTRKRNIASEESDGIRSARVVDGKGYGFIECTDTIMARRLLRAMDALTLEGRTLVVEYAKATPQSFAAVSNSSNKATEGSGSPTGDRKVQCPPGHSPVKLTVKNVPFEATLNDIKSLFASFSDVKSVRLPRRLYNLTGNTGNASHRGFAFVEFYSAKGAQEALRNLAHVHLYGRHLVLEYAAETETAGLHMSGE